MAARAESEWANLGGEKGGRMNRIQLLMMGIAASGPLLMTGAGDSQSLDPVVVNAKMEHVKLENSHVRVIEGVLQPGDREELHSHPAFVTYIVSGSTIRNHFADGKVVEAEFRSGDVLWRDPQTHWIENIGTTTLHFVLVELKNHG
jgi:quercetin dioxygenase-like cupin family protein